MRKTDLTCPDISLLPKLAQILNVTVDELLSGKQEADLPTVRLVPEKERKDLEDMILRIVVDSGDGDKIRVNLPLPLVQVALELGMEMPQINGNIPLKNVDLNQIMELVRRGAVGNLLEIRSSDGDIIRIFVE